MEEGQSCIDNPTEEKHDGELMIPFCRAKGAPRYGDTSRDGRWHVASLSGDRHFAIEDVEEAHLYLAVAR